MRPVTIQGQSSACGAGTCSPGGGGGGGICTEGGGATGGVGMTGGGGTTTGGGSPTGTGGTPTGVSPGPIVKGGTPGGGGGGILSGPGGTITFQPFTTPGPSPTRWRRRNLRRPALLQCRRRRRNAAQRRRWRGAPGMPVGAGGGGGTAKSRLSSLTAQPMNIAIHPPFGGPGTGGGGGSCGCNGGGTGSGGGSGPPGGGGGSIGGLPGGGSPGGGLGGLWFNGAPIVKSVGPPIVFTPFGGGSAALAPAAMPRIASPRAIAPITYSVGGCNSIGGSCVISPSNNNVLMQVAPPAGDLFYVAPVLSYNSGNSGTANTSGNGWFHTFQRQIQLSGNNPTVITGTGQTYVYTGIRGGGGYAIPASNSPAVNSLQSATGWTSLTETQPDGTSFHYGSAAGGTGSLLYLQNPAGARWTLTYNGSGAVSSVLDPVGRLTTFGYNATSGNLSSIQDPFGRLTTFTVNSAGDLVQVMTPELCISRMTYNSSHNLLAWINPLGDRTSFAYASTSLVVESPLGAVTTMTLTPSGGEFRPRDPSVATSTVVNPLGQVTTLGFNLGKQIVSAIDAVGNRTSYSWDSTGHLLSIGDGLGNTTTFGYVTNGTTHIESLTSIEQPLGGIFTYSYNSGGQVTSLIDQLGRVTTLVWNASGLRSVAVDAWGTVRRIVITAWVNWYRSRTHWATVTWCTTRWGSRSR